MQQEMQYMKKYGNNLKLMNFLMKLLKRTKKMRLAKKKREKKQKNI